MKFGHQLKTSLYPEWVFYYLAYDKLKHELKSRLNANNGQWTEDDETAFAELLEKELDKVYSFQKVKSAEIMSRLQHSKQEVEAIIQSDHAQNEDYAALEEELSHIIADVHDLAKFTRLNYTGFLKIIKKHDVREALPLPNYLIYNGPSFFLSLGLSFFSDARCIPVYITYTSALFVLLPIDPVHAIE